jgi:hypothetical protein
VSPARKTLARFGPKGQQVRVLVDGDRVIVQWREVGRLRKQFFDHTPEGRQEAKAWAKGASDGVAATFVAAISIASA